MSLILGDLGRIRLAEGDYAGAENAFFDAVVLTDELTAHDRDNVVWQRDHSQNLNQYGDYLLRTNQPDLALNLYSRALVVRRRLHESDLHNLDWQRDLAASLDRNALILLQFDRAPEALDMLREGLDLRRDLTKTEPENALWFDELLRSVDRVTGFLPRAEAESLIAEMQERVLAREARAQLTPVQADWRDRHMLK